MVKKDLLDSPEVQKDEDCIMSAGHVGIMANISSEASIFILAQFDPGDNLLYFGLWDMLLEGGEAGERPISSCHFKMFGIVFSDGVEIFTIFQREDVLGMGLSVEDERWAIVGGLFFLSLHSDHEYEY